MCTPVHGTSSDASARSITQGVRPPLTAKRKLPRNATAARASLAMATAPARATESSSSNTSSLRGACGVMVSSNDSRCHAEIFLVGRGRIMPTAGRDHVALIELARTPGPRFIFEGRSVGVQDRVHDSPGLFHVILTRKKRGVAGHGVAQKAFVRIHLFGARMTARDHFHHLGFYVRFLGHDG